MIITKLSDVDYLIKQTVVMMQIMIRDNKLSHTKFRTILKKLERIREEWDNTLRLYR